MKRIVTSTYRYKRPAAEEEVRCRGRAGDHQHPAEAGPQSRSGPGGNNPVA
jgi:hypothetical protein